MAFQTDTAATLARSESGDLIASDRVEGTNVYNRQGEKLGSIKNFMVGKRTGRVDYAVLKFGGLFGLNERNYPLPWDVLDYDTAQGGYVVDLDKDRLTDAPYYEADEPTYDRVYGERVYGYYGLPY